MKLSMAPPVAVIQFTTFGLARVNFIELHPTVGVIFNGAVVHGRWNFNDVGDINLLFHYTREESRVPAVPARQRHQQLVMLQVWVNTDPQRASMLVEVLASAPTPQRQS